MITLGNQHHHCANFFMGCMDIFTSRGKEYAPEDVPLWDVFVNAVKERVTVLTILRILMDKHVTAVRHFDLAGRTLHTASNGGSTIEGRFRDIANFAALQSFYVNNQTELHTTWRNHLVQSYQCVCDDAARNPRAYECQRCPGLNWLDAHPPSSRVCPPASARLGSPTAE